MFSGEISRGVAGDVGQASRCGQRMKCTVRVIIKLTTSSEDGKNILSRLLEVIVKKDVKGVARGRGNFRSSASPVEAR